MTARDHSEPRPSPAPPPGLDTELLAELDAGVLDGVRAAQLRAAAAADPAAAAVLAALAATRAELAALPVPPIPPGVADRWSAALRAEAAAAERTPGADPETHPGAGTDRDISAGTAPTSTNTSTSSIAVGNDNISGADSPPPTDPAAGRNTATAATADPPNRVTETGDKPRTPETHTTEHNTETAATAGRRLRITRGLPPSDRAGPAPRPSAPRPSAVAAAVLLLVLAAGLLWPRPGPPEPDGIDLAAAGRSALGSTDLGALADPVRRAGCLRAVGVLGLNPDARPLGGRRVELARGPGILLVYSTGELGVFDVVIVDQDCGPAGGTLLGTGRIGR